MTAIDKYLPQKTSRGIALCLSGGGFRAALFHLGALRRLNEFGLLSRCMTISSVSGGSVMNGVLAYRWKDLVPEGGPIFWNFDKIIGEPIRVFCKKDLRTNTILWGRINPANWFKLAKDDFSVTDLLAKTYAEELGLGFPLTSLPITPKFVFCATNLETGVNWQFTREEIGDYKVGFAPSGPITVAQAVAASSAFPLAFPPLVLKFDDTSQFKGGKGNFSPDVLKRVPLTDGGVYDNLGLEPVWKDHEYVLVSNAGHPYEFMDDPKQNVVERLTRCFDTTSNQSEAIRKRWLIHSFINMTMKGTYLGIGTDYADYELQESMGYSPSVRELLMKVRTDFDPFSEGEIWCLENHGYSLVDAAIRKHVMSMINPPLINTAFQWPSEKWADEDRASQALASSDQRGVLKDIWKSIRDGIRNVLK